MFHYDAGLFLTRAALAVDVRRRQPRCFVSHAHTDHIARHELALATPVTARFYRHRLGHRYRVLEMPYREPIEFGPLRLVAYPAGHCLGSAMLWADDGRQSLLYTGDFKLDVPATAEPAELPHADILVMESTFGLPRYRMPPRETVIAQLIELVRAALADGNTPVIHAYPLGKSQEVTKLLTMHGIPVLQHPAVYEFSRIYQACGVDLGPIGVYDPPLPSGAGRRKGHSEPSPSGRGQGEGSTEHARLHVARAQGESNLPLPLGEGRGEGLASHAVVTLPRGMSDFRLPGLGKTVSIAPTGWAMDPSTKYRLGVDYALPLSDHADFDQLIETVRRVEPREIYCTHGPHEFVDHLRDLGLNAFPLNPPPQRRLF